ncbi:MAG: fasciclin domain-containing protein [Parvularculaceae bacterium]|nr:fasciclin domain-containing protein [Parvularculaceae bacterium]
MALKLLAAIAALGLAVVPAYANHHEKNKEMAKADIVDTAVAAGQFTTLVAAVQAAGLEEALRAPGNKTVFAPTDAAFAALPAGTVEDLLKPENKGKLAAILTYHVVDGKTESADLIGKTLTVKTLNGAELAIDATNGVKVGAANVVKADVYASNGVIHVIDTVLLPPAAE